MEIRVINNLPKIVAIDELKDFKIGHEAKSETQLINKC